MYVLRAYMYVLRVYMYVLRAYIRAKGIIMYVCPYAHMRACTYVEN
jgi:hypothetical protein